MEGDFPNFSLLLSMFSLPAKAGRVEKCKKSSTFILKIKKNEPFYKNY